MFTLILFLAVFSGYVPILMGLTFLEKEPTHFECYHDETGEWTECSKTEICENHYDHEHYRAVEDDDYIDNWVEKYDMLCEPKYRIGLLGAFFFLGVIITMIPVPRYADVYGRRDVFIVTMIVCIIAGLGLLLANSLEWAYFFMLILGMTFAGKLIVGLNYLIEL
jgi:MFS family permease